MHNRTALTVLSALTAATLAGCSGSDGQAAPTSGSPQPSQPANSDLFGAPKVKNPVDSSRFHKDPCSALTPEQVKKLAPTSKPGTYRPDATAGPSCSWVDSESGNNFNVTFGTNGSGLKTLYQRHEMGANKLQIELPDIQGHPAIIYGIIDSRKTGNCGVAVGLTDDLIMEGGVQLNSNSPHYSDPCGFAKQVADAAMQTVKGGT